MAYLDFVSKIGPEMDHTPVYIQTYAKRKLGVVYDTSDPYDFDAFVLADRTDILLFIYKYCKQTTTIIAGTNCYIFTQVMCLKRSCY